MTVQPAPYGSWSSPLSAAHLVEGAVRLGFPCRAGPFYFWQEGRPYERGRVALVRREVGGDDDVEVLPAHMSARTTAHEYGGRAWAVDETGLLVTSNFADQRLWLLRPGCDPAPLSAGQGAPGTERFAGPVISPDGAWVACVRERHLEGGVDNDLVAFALKGGPGGPRVLAEGHHFYSSPQWSPDGSQLAFVCWDHPDMPWDRTQLWRGAFADGELLDPGAVVPAEAGESVLQPRWGPDGRLCYVSDRQGWWNLYDAEGHPLAPMEAEFAGPAWEFGDSHYVFLSDGTLLATWRREGRARLGPVADGRAAALDLAYTSFDDLAPAGPAAADGVLAVAASPRRAAELIRVNPEGDVEVLRRSRPAVLPDEYCSVGQPVSFPTGDGEQAHALFYAPLNPLFRALPGELPPLIVTSHGGPTSHASDALNLAVQYWTTRGFAVVNVDYRGSTGYGRRYRQALDGRWGEADVEDCARAADWLSEQGWADPGRVVTRGGSASGLTVLAGLARSRTFAAGTVYYGVSDLEALAAETHKFESRYIDRLVPPAERAARSPVNLTARVTAPVLFLQGLDDKVVPPGQSRGMVRALRAAGVRAFLVEIEGEGHGFRQATSLVRSQELELAFYAGQLGFAPDGLPARAVADLAEAASGDGARWE